VPACF